MLLRACVAYELDGHQTKSNLINVQFVSTHLCLLRPFCRTFLFGLMPDRCSLKFFGRFQPSRIRTFTFVIQFTRLPLNQLYEVLFCPVSKLHPTFMFETLSSFQITSWASMSSPARLVGSGHLTPSPSQNVAPCSLSRKDLIPAHKLGSVSHNPIASAQGPASIHYRVCFHSFLLLSE